VVRDVEITRKGKPVARLSIAVRQRHGRTSMGTLSCSFCGKEQNEVAQLIAGPNAYICDECTRLCVTILRDKGLWKNQ